MATGTLSTIQSGSRKLLVKANPVYALQIHAGQIYAATSSLDGAVVKVSLTQQNKSKYMLIDGAVVKLYMLIDVHIFSI